MIVCSNCLYEDLDPGFPCSHCIGDRFTPKKPRRFIKEMGDDFLEITIKDGKRKYNRAIAKGDINLEGNSKEYVLNEVKDMIEDFVETDNSLKASCEGGEAL